MKLWKKLLLYFVSLVGTSLVSMIIVMACGGEVDPYDYYTSFFHADVQGKKDYEPFYFTDYQFTYTDDEPQSEAAINSAEWARYLGQEVAADDVQQVMYQLDSAGKKEILNYLSLNEPLPDSLAKSRFLQALKSPRHTGSADYYHFALEAEKLAQYTYDYWDPAPRDTSGLKDAATRALSLALDQKDQFLKLRYLYQAQKLNHYAENYTEAQAIYDQYITSISSASHVKGWALALKAGEERRLGDTTQAAYLFSKVFAGYPERRVQAYRNYHYIAPPFADVLALAKNPAEKANLYAIKGFANPELESEALEQVYDNAPASSLVGVLLVREINKLEQYYLTPALANNTDEDYSKVPEQKVSVSKERAPVAKWPLWTGLALLGAGILSGFIAAKHEPYRVISQIAAGVLAVTGIFALGWFVTAGSADKTTDIQASESQFFVSLPDSVTTKYDKHINKLRDFCSRLAADGTYPEPQLGMVADAYLCFMQNKTDEGMVSLAKLKGQKLTGKLAGQQQIVNLLLSAQRLKQLNAVDEAALLPSLQWLQNEANTSQFAITERNFYTYVLAPSYLRQGDTVKAALAMLKAINRHAANYSSYIDEQIPDFWFKYLRPVHLEQLINWKKQPQSDSYLAFLGSGLKNINTDKLYELLGTTQLREHQYAEAVVAFKNIRSSDLKTASYNGTNYYGDDGSYQGDPFYAAINDYPKPVGGKRYTKLGFAQKMAELTDRSKKAPQEAEVWYQMATGLYNTSTYGNSWGLISYNWHSDDFGRKMQYYYDGDYIRTSLAKQYYLKARELSGEPEFKARCTFMAAKCEQKSHEAPSFIDNYETYTEQEKIYRANLLQNRYFEEMKQYQHTRFYQKAVNECSYLLDFISPASN